jgi:hypothetical protein
LLDGDANEFKFCALMVNLKAWGDNLVTITNNRFNSLEYKWKELHDKRVVRILKPEETEREPELPAI